MYNIENGQFEWTYLLEHAIYRENIRYIIYDYRNWIKIILQRNLQTIISCYQLWVFYIMTIDKNWDTFICEGHLWPVEYKKMYAIYINYFIYCSIKE